MHKKHLDVVIVGAGLSGICAAWYLQDRCPGRSFTILEGRETLGGTWDLFRYPGIRSDSDMFTLGYSFRPWGGEKSIADGPDILDYLTETAEAYGIDQKIRYGRRVVATRWSSDDGYWTIEVECSEGKESETYTCDFFWVCAGYYRYDAGYTPDFVDADRFEGTLVHPQHWPEDLDYEGKRVVVIGSGATAMTLVPAMAKGGAHVTMLQRSPTWVISRPAIDPIAVALRQWLPAGLAHTLVRWKNILLTLYFYQTSQKRPREVERLLLAQIRAALGADFDVDKHFKPSYDPWNQRVCLVPDGDLFKVIRSGDVDVVTDHIERFDEEGIVLRSGAHLPADIIVTATGLQLEFLGGATLEVDGEQFPASSRMLYRGAMVEDVPNAAVTIGYTNASWTLKAELTSQFVCELLAHMERHGYSTCTPRSRDVRQDQGSVLDLDAGYVRRSKHLLPRQGDRDPWRVKNNYVEDLVGQRLGRIDDGYVEFGKR